MHDRIRADRKNIPLLFCFDDPLKAYRTTDRIERSRLVVTFVDCCTSSDIQSRHFRLDTLNDQGTFRSTFSYEPALEAGLANPTNNTNVISSNWLSRILWNKTSFVRATGPDSQATCLHHLLRRRILLYVWHRRQTLLGWSIAGG